MDTGRWSGHRQRRMRSAHTCANPRPHHYAWGAGVRDDGGVRLIEEYRRRWVVSLAKVVRAASTLLAEGGTTPAERLEIRDDHRKVCVVGASRRAAVYQSMDARVIQRTRVLERVIGTLLIQRTRRPLNTTVCAVLGACDLPRLRGMGEHDGSTQLDVCPHQQPFHIPSGILHIIAEMN